VKKPALILYLTVAIFILLFSQCTFQSTRYIIGRENIDAWTYLVECNHSRALYLLWNQKDSIKDMSTVSSMLLEAVIYKDLDSIDAYKKAAGLLDEKYPPSTKDETKLLVRNLISELHKERRKRQLPAKCNP
jgi:hypothetical protein